MENELFEQPTMDNEPRGDIFQVFETSLYIHSTF